MVPKIVQFTATGFCWLFCVGGVVALALAAMLSTPLSIPPTLDSIEKTAKAFDRTGVPDTIRFQARDGSFLTYRLYPAAAPDTGRIALLLHGSSASSLAMHTLAKVLAARGMAAYAIDVRGHGGSGTHGDIGYSGQLDDDIADMAGMIRKTRQDAPMVLIGHSSGGGFALRVAGSPNQGFFHKTILLAPYLGYRAPTSRPDAGGWARPDLPRIFAIMALEHLGLPCCDAMPVLAFAVPKNSRAILTPVYSYRLMTNYATHRDYRDDIATAHAPMVVFAGADDELMIADRYADAMTVGQRTVPVHLIAGVNHMAIVSDPTATAAIAAAALTD